MPPALTEKEWFAEHVRQQRQREHVQERGVTR
jgi:hypothetical protein